VRYPKKQKAETRGRILEAAARLFRESGYDGAGVDAIMAEAGLTAGGFYSHFRSKEALFAEAMTTALEPQHLLSGTRPNHDPLVSLIKSYLSRTHRDMTGAGCPLPAVTSDVARQGDSTREAYERQFLKYVDEIETMLADHSGESRERALAIIAQCVGGLMLSRAVKDSKLSDQILRACRSAALEIGDVDNGTK